MLRGSTLKRSGFRRQPPPPRVRPTLKPILPGAWRAVAPNGAAPAAIEKHSYIRSKKLREAYRLIPCQNCGADDGTVCCAHSNWGVHGKGERIKADDNRGASLCARCHVPLLDQGTALSRAERKALWWGAHVKTVRLLVGLGHWPAGVPIPDIETCPFEIENDEEIDY
jgi:hypothetical protein